jgi:hypothetical protein
MSELLSSSFVDFTFFISFISFCVLGESSDFLLLNRFKEPLADLLLTESVSNRSSPSKSSPKSSSVSLSSVRACWDVFLISLVNEFRSHPA